MNKLPRSIHPPWCTQGSDCVPLPGLHVSRLVNAAPRGNEVIQVGAALWRMDVDPTSPEGVLLEFSIGEEKQRWPIDLAQSRALVPILQELLGQALSVPALSAV